MDVYVETWLDQKSCLRVTDSEEKSRGSESVPLGSFSLCSFPVLSVVG